MRKLGSITKIIDYTSVLTHENDIGGMEIERKIVLIRFRNRL